MRLYKHNDKNKLQSHIWEYKRRRGELREKYGVKNGLGAPQIYKEKVYNINLKIRGWQKMIEDIEKRDNQLIAIANHLCYFLGINIKNSINYTDKKHRLARNIYYKYCLENNISATLVAEYVGASRGDIAARGRLSFNKSFEKHPENRDVYRRWETYINEIKNELPE